MTKHRFNVCVKTRRVYRLHAQLYSSTQCQKPTGWWSRWLWQRSNVEYQYC